MDRSALTVAGSLVLAACALVAGCSSLAAPSAVSSTATAISVSTASPPLPPAVGSAAAASGGSPPGASSPAADAVPICANVDLTVAVGESGAGLGHVSSTIVFTNGSDHPCTMSGYPEVTGVDGAGREMTHALQTLSGYMGGSYTTVAVLLGPGGRASALVEGTDVPTGTATTCPVNPRLLVTAPDQTDSHVLVVSMPGCSPLQVHPVVAGATGRA